MSLLETKSAAILARIRQNMPVNADAAIGDGSILKKITDLLKGLFGGLLGGLCPSTPAAIHESLTNPTNRQERVQARQLTRSVGHYGFDPNTAVAIEDAVTEEKLALTLEETTGLIAEVKAAR